MSNPAKRLSFAEAKSPHSQLRLTEPMGEAPTEVIRTVGAGAAARLRRAAEEKERELQAVLSRLQQAKEEREAEHAENCEDYDSDGISESDADSEKTIVPDSESCGGNGEPNRGAGSPEASTPSKRVSPSALDLLPHRPASLSFNTCVFCRVSSQKSRKAHWCKIDVDVFNAAFTDSEDEAVPEEASESHFPLIVEPIMAPVEHEPMSPEQETERRLLEEAPWKTPRSQGARIEETERLHKTPPGLRTSVPGPTKEDEAVETRSTSTSWPRFRSRRSPPRNTPPVLVQQGEMDLNRGTPAEDAIYARVRELMAWEAALVNRETAVTARESEVETARMKLNVMETEFQSKIQGFIMSASLMLTQSETPRVFGQLPTAEPLATQRPRV
eukprot:m.157864 g.157864  ORF g.157864 m.157864 type:complete len:386 (+) comp14486_c0_seq1:277-1434(+)